MGSSTSFPRSALIHSSYSNDTYTIHYHSLSSPLLYTLFICAHLHASYYNLFTFIHNLYSQRNIIIGKHCWPAATLKSKAHFAVTATKVIISILLVHEQRFLYVHINEQQHRHDLRVKPYYYHVILYRFIVVMFAGESWAMAHKDLWHKSQLCYRRPACICHTELPLYWEAWEPSCSCDNDLLSYVRTRERNIQQLLCLSHLAHR